MQMLKSVKTFMDKLCQPTRIPMVAACSSWPRSCANILKDAADFFQLSAGCIQHGGFHGTAQPPCAVTEKSPGTEIANVYASCAAVPDVPAFFDFWADRSSGDERCTGPNLV
jgi:hypothetical protein